MRVKESFLEVGHQLERLSGALNQVASQGMEGMQEIIQEHATRTADEGSLAGTEGSTRVTGEGSGDSTEGGSTVATGAGSGVGGGDAKAERETIKEGAEKGNESDVAGDVQGGVGEERRGNAQGGAATAVEL